MAVDQLHSLMIFIIAFCLFRDPRKDAKKLAWYMISLNVLFFAYLYGIDNDKIFLLQIISFTIGSIYVTNLVRNINFAKYTVRRNAPLNNKV